MTYNVTADLWYQYFAAPGPHAAILVLVYGLRSLWALFCIGCNCGIVRVTCASKKLHGICNVLIAMECALYSVNCVGYLLPFGLFLSGVKFLHYTVCAPLVCFLDTFGNLCQMTMVCTGMERLLGVMFPFWYKDRKHRHVLPFVWLGQAAYALYWTVLYTIDYAGVNPEIMVSCSPTDMGQGPMGPVMNSNSITLSALLMVTYGLLWFLVFGYNRTAKDVKVDNRKLIKSLIIIIGLNMIGVFLKNVFQLLSALFPMNVFTKNCVGIAFSFFSMTVYSANGPILYMNNDMYRMELRKRYKWLPKFGHNKVTIVQHFHQQQQQHT